MLIDVLCSLNVAWHTLTTMKNVDTVFLGRLICHCQTKAVQDHSVSALNTLSQVRENSKKVKHSITLMIDQMILDRLTTQMLPQLFSNTTQTYLVDAMYDKLLLLTVIGS